MDHRSFSAAVVPGGGERRQLKMQGRTTVIVRGAPKQPLIAINDDDRGAYFVDLIRRRVPELSAPDLVLVAQSVNAAQRTKRPARPNPGARAAEGG